MKINKIFESFQIVSRWSYSNVAIFVILSFLLTPSHPFREEEGHWIEQLDHTIDSGDNYELLKIYSIVKSQRADLKDSLAWDISNTILEESRRHSFDPLLVLAVIDVESRFQHAAVSTEGARGLMQIRPIVATALAKELETRDNGIKEPFEDSQNDSTIDSLNLDDPILNIRLGVFYLHSLKKNFRDLKLALTAYNWGPTEVRNRLEEDEGLPLDYAMKVLSTYHSYRKDSR